jgi:hypothetical protein
MKTCSKCKLEKELLDFHKNKNSKDGFCEKCKKCKNDYSKKYRLDNIDYFKEYGKNYIKDEKYIEYHKNYNKEYFQNKLKEERKLRKEIDYLFKIKCNIHSRTSNIFKKKKFKNNNSIHSLLKCDYNTLINHLENKFIDNMNFNNYGEWHIDHIIPLHSAKTEEELIKLCHYTNLQPLWAKDNISKGCKIM